jgi:hypothetical protein
MIGVLPWTLATQRPGPARPTISAAVELRHDLAQLEQDRLQRFRATSVTRLLVRRGQSGIESTCWVTRTLNLNLKARFMGVCGYEQRVEPEAKGKSSLLPQRWNRTSSASLRQKKKAACRHRGGIEPLGRQPSPDLKSGPSASQAHCGNENVWKARVSIPVPLAC